MPAGIFKAAQTAANKVWNAGEAVAGRINKWTSTAKANTSAGTAMVPYSAAGARISQATYPFRRFSTTAKVGAVGAAGMYGYASGEGTPYQRAERAAGMAAGVGIGVSSSARRGIKNAFTPKANNTVTDMAPYTATGAAAGALGFATAGRRGMAIGALGGGLYGAIDEDMNFATGAATGMGAMLLGRGAAKGIAAGHKIGVRTGAAAGGAAGLMMGGPIGMAIGAGLGGAGGGAFRFARAHPTMAKWGGAAGLVGVGSAAIVGDAALQAYEMHQYPRSTNFGADGDLALGLHSLRHG